MYNKAKIISVLILVILAAGAFVYMSNYMGKSERSGEEGDGNTEQEISSGSSETVQVTETNITQGGISKLPSGFPSSIPVETINVKESYRVDYTDKGVTQYTVSYASMRTSGELWAVYYDFMNEEGYLIDEDVTSESLGQVTGFFNNDSLSVVISNQDGRSLVQMNLLVRK
ncbi:MAG: hypothetical protein ACYCY6_00740 [Minisyncoccota bacterium]